MADQIRPTPRSPILGLFSDLVNLPLEYMSAPQRTQQMQGVAEFIRSTGVPSTLERLSYGQGLFTGAGGLGGTTRLRPEVAEAALTVAPMAGPAARLAGRGAMAVGRAGERYAERVVPQIMERGGLPAEMVSAMGQGTQSPLTVYHGSPYRFNRFDPTKIGSGEGAQAYGYGHYVAESPGVATSYKNLVQRDPNRLMVDGKVVSPDTMYGRAAEDVARIGVKATLQKIDDNIRFNEKYAPDMAAMYKDLRTKIELLEPSRVSLKEGNLYTIDLPDPAIARMLDWDKPLVQQSAAIGQQLSNVIEKAGAGNYYNRALRGEKSLAGIPTTGVTGEKLYKRIADVLGGDQIASDVLRSGGLTGIRYLDAASRNAKSGTSNFVVFPGNEDLLRILEVNGEELLNPIMYRDPFGSTVR